jgi:hypothetical protein
MKLRKIYAEKTVIYAILNFFSVLGISLIGVPYWWDRKYESLAATIYTQRPDYFLDPPLGKPIPALPPSEYQKKTGDIKGVTINSIQYSINLYRSEKKSNYDSNSLGRSHGSQELVITVTMTTKILGG